jgi:cell division septation protein DedD
MGSGVNLNLSDPPPQPKTAPVAAPAVKPAEEKPAGEKTAVEKPSGEKQAGERTAAEFLVQIASYRDKQEAEVAKAKLSARGIAAYVVESKVKERGVWYRLRVGRHLSRQEAEQLAGKVGSGATVLPE